MISCLDQLSTLASSRSVALVYIRVAEVATATRKWEPALEALSAVRGTENMQAHKKLLQFTDLLAAQVYL